MILKPNYSTKNEFASAQKRWEQEEKDLRLQIDRLKGEKGDEEKKEKKDKKEKKEKKEKKGKKEKK